jgi:hypothetical protein
MTKKLLTAYWCIIAAVQAYLLYYKLQLNAFIVWNIVALAAALLFIYGNTTQNTRLRIFEITIAVFLIINGVSAFATQIIMPLHPAVLYGAIPVIVLSGTAVYLLTAKKADRI